VGKLIGRGLNVFGQVVLARLLGPELFGLYAIGWTILSVVRLIAPLGLDKGVIRFAAQYWPSDQARLKGVWVQSLGLALSSGLLLGVGFYIVAPWLEQVYQKPGLSSVVRWLAIAFPLATGLIVAAATTRVSQRTKFSVYAQDVSQPLVNLILILTFYWLGWGISGALAAGIISFGLGFALAIYYVRRLFPAVFQPRIKSTFSGKEFLVFSLSASLAGAFGMFMVWSDRLIVAYFRPLAEVGIYQAASQTTMLFGIILSAFAAICSPMIVDLSSRKQTKRLETLYRVSIKWTLYLSIPIFLTICFAPREFMVVVFGVEYKEGWLPLVILSVGQMMIVATGTMGLILTMSGYQNRWATIVGTMLIVNIVLNLILVPQWGLIGAALSTACTLGVRAAWGVIQLKYTLGIWPYDRRLLKGLIATTLTALGLFFLAKSGITSPTLKLLFTAMVSFGIFWAALLIFFGLDPEDQEVSLLIKSRLLSALS
jgi:O-antigen/teichoic acid export membrane protein